MRRASGALLIERGRVLLIHHPNKGDRWGVPGGKERRADVAGVADPSWVTAVRELEEETGLRAIRGDRVQRMTTNDQEGPLEWTCWMVSHWTGNLSASDEGEPRWIPLADIDELRLMPSVGRMVGAGLDHVRRDAAVVIERVSNNGQPAAPWVGESRWRVVVGEVMSQQTQLSRAIERWRRWVDRWPDETSCAAASLDDVLREWQGLGYPRRARALHCIARTVSVEGWPDDYLTLPGVGPYTAAAIAAFADGEMIIPQDANVARVIARRLPSLDQHRPNSDDGRILMEFGQSVCRATPRCELCPVATGCSVPLGHDPAPRPAKQAPYEGSFRQRRGIVLRAALAGDSLPDDTEAIESLRRDELL